ncbi:YciI family protein [Xanthomonas sp. XNM01]|uniref:YciI family protein n=1 Tax=Xanthomonas sp. XNM01 TaxID=2769289 RepID=UPI001780CD95|nr:YciI family protein [Xanthomonas sp. XNM01]MBD9371006.1 YciI family protein [Xanthomonas sp. XNM01]
MKFALLVYTDPALLQALPAEEYDRLMRDCIHHADALRADGKLLGSQKLQPAVQARTVRIREGRPSVFDGPFAETKELLGGVNILEVDTLEEAVAIAHDFPWARYGSMEVRPLDDLEHERVRVGA